MDGAMKILDLLQKFPYGVDGNLNLTAHPDYQNKGVTAILFNDLQTMFNRRGITEVETNPELIENKSIQAFWKNYKNILHKKRCTYKKDIK